MWLSHGDTQRCMCELHQGGGRGGRMEGDRGREALWKEDWCDGAEKCGIPQYFSLPAARDRYFSSPPRSCSKEGRFSLSRCIASAFFRPRSRPASPFGACIGARTALKFIMSRQLKGRHHRALCCYARQSSKFLQFAHA